MHRAAVPGTDSVPVFKGPLLWAPKVPTSSTASSPPTCPPALPWRKGPCCPQEPPGPGLSIFISQCQMSSPICFMSTSPCPQEAVCPLPDGKMGLGRASKLPQVTQLVGSGTVIHTPLCLSQCSGTFSPQPQASQRGTPELSVCVGTMCVGGEAVC